MPAPTMRIDKLLWFLRWAKTRGLAQDLVEQGHIRRNGQRVERCSASVGVGDILVLPQGASATASVLVIEILALPSRRGPPAEAQSHYRALDERRVLPIAGCPSTVTNQGEAHP